MTARSRRLVELPAELAEDDARRLAVRIRQDMARHGPGLDSAELAARAWSMGVAVAEGAMIGRRTCRICGCRQDRACWDEATGYGCHWVADDLCSACDTIEPQLRERADVRA